MFGRLSRSALMARIRSRNNSTTELKLLSLFKAERLRGWRRGYRLFGRPDFVFPKERLAVFVDGCFWHGHDCRNLRPRTNARFWRVKISRNQDRDRRVVRILRAAGWRTVRVWECDLKSKNEKNIVRRLRRALKRRKNTAT